MLHWFRPWSCRVRLDIFHFMRRFNKGLTTEAHPLYGTFCSKLSNCIFEWDSEDYSALRAAKRVELQRQRGNAQQPSEQQVTAAITTSELALHCRRCTRPAHTIKALINKLLQEMWDRTDTNGLHLISGESMKEVWATQQKHLPCIQDPDGVSLYTQTGTREKGGKLLKVLRCARGSSSVESFHGHQCAFIPGQ
jgi:hypothetical protein